MNYLLVYICCLPCKSTQCDQKILFQESVYIKVNTTQSNKVVEMNIQAYMRAAKRAKFQNPHLKYQSYSNAVMT